MINMIVDDVLVELCSRRIAAEWTGLGEITEVIRKSGLSQEISKEIAYFLEKYFVQADEGNEKVKINPWVYGLFECFRK